jgi:hypothetical protein
MVAPIFVEMIVQDDPDAALSDVISALIRCTVPVPAPKWNDIAVVQDFIKQYPNTPTALNDAKQYLDVLDRRIKEREAKARMEAEAAQAWSRIQNGTDQAELRSFMKRYPDAAVTLTHAAPRLAALEH